MLKIVSTGSQLCAIERRRPLVTSLGEAPYLIGRYAEITEYLPERLAVVDRIQELVSSSTDQPPTPILQVRLRDEEGR